MLPIFHAGHGHIHPPPLGSILMPSDNRKGKEIKDITDRWMYTIVMDVREGSARRNKQGRNNHQ